MWTTASASASTMPEKKHRTSLGGPTRNTSCCCYSREPSVTQRRSPRHRIASSVAGAGRGDRAGEASVQQVAAAENLAATALSPTSTSRPPCLGQGRREKRSSSSPMLVFVQKRRETRSTSVVAENAMKEKQEELETRTERKIAKNVKEKKEFFFLQRKKERLHFSSFGKKKNNAPLPTTSRRLITPSSPLPSPQQHQQDIQVLFFLLLRRRRHGFFRGKRREKARNARPGDAVRWWHGRRGTPRALRRRLLSVGIVFFFWISIEKGEQCSS